MKSLFIDTTDHLVLGILDSNYNWISYIDLDETKSSGIIHKKIYDLLKKENLEVKNLSKVFYISGPGSYTGMRLSVGITQMLDWIKIKTYSFHHFQIPFLMEENSGHWISNAFKNELFIYNWSGQSSDSRLISIKKFIEEINQFSNGFYTHFEHRLQDEILSEIPVIKSTSKILYDNSSIVFSKIVDLNQKMGPFYYRSQDKEFKASFTSRS